MRTRPWVVRPASLIDVTHIVRLGELTDGSQEPAPLPHPSGLLDGQLDSAKLGSTARIFLSHGALEHGRVFVAEDDDGIAAASVWLPSNVSDPVGVMTDLGHLLEREVGLPRIELPVVARGEHMSEVSAGLIEAVASAQADWFLLGLLTRPDLLDDHSLIEALIAPMADEGSLAAIALRPSVSHALTGAGFTPSARALILPNPNDELEIVLLIRPRQPVEIPPQP